MANIVLLLVLYIVSPPSLRAQPASANEGNGVSSGVNFPLSVISFATHSYENPGVQEAINARADWLNTQIDQNSASDDEAAGIHSLVTHKPIPGDLQKAFSHILQDAQHSSESSQTLLEDLTSVKGGSELSEDFGKVLSSLRGLTQGGQVSPEKLLQAWQVYSELVEKASLVYMSGAPPSMHALQFIFTIFTRS